MHGPYTFYSKIIQDNTMVENIVPGYRSDVRHWGDHCLKSLSLLIHVYFKFIRNYMLLGFVSSNTLWLHCKCTRQSKFIKGGWGVLFQLCFSDSLKINQVFPKEKGGLGSTLPLNPLLLINLPLAAEIFIWAFNCLYIQPVLIIWRGSENGIFFSECGYLKPLVQRDLSI